MKYDNPLQKKVFETYARVAGLGAVTELKLRLLAGVTPSIAHLAHTQDRLEDLENKVLSAYEDHVTPEELNHLTESRRLRNKVLHSDFKAASSKVESLRPGSTSPGKAFKVPLNTFEMTPVSDSSRKDGTVFGWLMETFLNGTLTQSEEIFDQAIHMDRLTFEKSSGKITPK